MDPRRTTRPRSPLPAATGLALVLGAGSILRAQVAQDAVQPIPPMTTNPVPELPVDVSGRDFAGLRLPHAMQHGTFVLSAQRATAWVEEPQAGPRVGTTIGGPVQRLYLRADVRVKLGPYTFAAARAVVWIEQLEDSKAYPGQHVHQVAIFFDRVNDPTAEAGVSQAGDRLLLTGVIDSDPTLKTDLLEQGRPASDAFITESETRLARQLATYMGDPALAYEPPPAPYVPPLPGGKAPIVPGMTQPFEPDSPLANPLPPELPPELPPAERLPPIFARQGIVNFSAGELTLVPSTDEDAILITGGVIVQYSDTRQNRQLQISAERACAFLDPGTFQAAGRSAAADRVRGIYLEGNVIASDGRFTLRGQRAYYDFKANRAVMIDAVFNTFDQRRGMPLYVRAAAIRQTAANQITAKETTLSNSSFFEPFIAIGTSNVTVTHDESRPGPARNIIEGKNLTARAGGVPFFYYPSFEGELDRFPLRGVSFQNSSDSGFSIKTTWDIFGMLGLDAPEKMRADLHLDGYFDRGFGMGADGQYDFGTTSGSFLSYLLPSDDGTDTLPPGTKIEHNGDTRGIIAAEHRWSIDPKWTVFLQGTYISDVNFVQEFYTPLAENRREFESSIYTRRLDDNTSFSVLTKGSFNAFTPNQYLLESQGYTVDKLPEAAYQRVADDLLSGIAPGLLNYSSQYSVGRMKFNFTNYTPAELGFTTNALAQQAFGINANQSIAGALMARGLNQNDVTRFDTRQELDAKFSLGPVSITPFFVGRVTAYDNDFGSFSPNNDNQIRYWGAAGITAATSIQHVDDSVQSSFFDLHRMRHIIEFSATGWASGTNRESSTLPIYDDTVENLVDGSMVKTGINQVWQTQRGGDGRWHSVDVFKLNTEFVHDTNDTNVKSPIGRFVDFRPEYSQPGQFLNAEAAWQLTDATALSAHEIYDTQLHQSTLTSAGMIIQHSKDFSTFGEVYYVNPLNSTYVNFGGEYRLTAKYTLAAIAAYDIDLNEFQSVGFRIKREFPNFAVVVSVNYSTITSETNVGVTLKPITKDDRVEQLRSRLDPNAFDTGEVPADANSSAGKSSLMP